MFFCIFPPSFLLQLNCRLHHSPGWHVKLHSAILLRTKRHPADNGPPCALCCFHCCLRFSAYTLVQALSSHNTGGIQHSGKLRKSSNDLVLVRSAENRIKTYCDCFRDRPYTLKRPAGPDDPPGVYSFISVFSMDHILEELEGFLVGVTLIKWQLILLLRMRDETIKRQNRVCRDYCLPKKTMIESYKQKGRRIHSVGRCTCAVSSDVTEGRSG